MCAFLTFFSVLQTDKPNKDSKNKFPKPGRLVLGPVVLTWDSSSVAVCGGEGIVGGVKYQFADTLSGVPETTLSVGVGGSVGGPALNASAAATINVTFAGECEFSNHSFAQLLMLRQGTCPWTLAPRRLWEWPPLRFLESMRLSLPPPPSRCAADRRSVSPEWACWEQERFPCDKAN
jgi:hypothetical protein